MEILELMKSRHSVRKYQDVKIEQEKRDILSKYLVNKNGVRIVACYDEPKAFESPDVHYGWFVNARNYFVLIGKKNNQLHEEMLGYEGEKLVLKAQEIGLNTCWVALTYDKEKVPVKIEEDEFVYSVITVGYGFKNGKERPSKTPEDVVKCNTQDAPEWFNLAVEACLLAPTAKNMQRFEIVKEADKYCVVKTAEDFYVNIDLGILKCHFDLIEGTTSL